MDVIKAFDDFYYYHSVTGEGLENWEAWKQQAAKDWGLVMGKHDSTAALKELPAYDDYTPGLWRDESEAKNEH